MAEVVGIIGSAIAIANSAATLSRALYEIVETIHNARREIADIALQLQLLSGTLHMLWDYIRSHEHLCRPGLYHNTNAILEQYLQVDKELRDLVKTPKNLARLTWYIKQKKIKSLLKKIEAIKTSLCLALNVVQLAGEEAIRPPMYSPSTVPADPLPNRFRKLVESAVQANRQVVESAQRQAAADIHTNSDQRRSEVDLYKEGSFDTATWLYHLIFETQSSSTPAAQSATQSPRPFQASVADEATEHLVRFAHPPAEKVSEPSVLEPTDVDKTMIVWGRQTEPEQVVDRLLSQWTTLSPEQIKLSSTRQHDDDWWESFQKVVEEAKVEAESDFEKWDMQYSSDDVDSVIEELSAPHTNTEPFPSYTDNAVPSRPRSPSSGSGSIISLDVPSSEQVRKEDKRKPWKQTQRNYKVGSKRKKVNLAGSRKHSSRPSSRPMPGLPAGEDGLSSETFPRWNPEPRSEPSRHSQRVPFRQATTPGHHHSPVRPNDPYYHNLVPPPWYYPQTAPVPQHAPWPLPGQTYPAAPPVPGSSGDQSSGRSNVQNKSTRDGDMLAALGSILEAVKKEGKSAVNDDGFERIAHTLLAQQEQAQLENERIRKRAEEEVKQILTARDQDDARIQRLEEQLVQQRAEQVDANARWQAERTALHHKAAEQTRQVQDLAEREIAAAKKAERKAVNMAKAEAEERAREAADSLVRAERKRMDEEHKERISKYENLLDRSLDTQSQALTVKDQPFRRTCIINGNNRMEVEEYSDDMRATSNVLTTRFLEQAALGVGSNGKDQYHQSRSPQRKLGQTGTGRGTLASSIFSEVASSTAYSSNEDRQMILFPPHLDQSSSKIHALQSSLANIGLDVKFADLETEDYSDWSLKDQGTDIVRSSVFWEAPVLSSGSELLNTLKSFGWQPPYARSSDAGQTFFLGSQPIHSYFFRPDYRPQFSPCKALDFSESIVIDQALVQDYALLEAGLQFEITKSGSYVLDGRLQYSDIEALVERSFAMRETYYRRAYRQLAPAPARIPSIRRPRRESTPQYFEEPQSPASTIESDTCKNVSDSEDDDGHLERRSSFASSSSADTCLGLEPSGRSSNPSVKTTSGSRTSWSSQSNNPFRKHGSAMSMSKSECMSSDGGSMTSFQKDSIWDGALIDLS